MIIACLFAAIAPELAFAGASPFTTGATAASTNLLAILTPIAVVAVMALGAAAWFNLRSSTNIAVGLSFPLVGSLAGDSQLIVGALDELLTRAWR
jgi:hypothetical protein